MDLAENCPVLRDNWTPKVGGDIVLCPSVVPDELLSRANAWYQTSGSRGTTQNPAG